MIIIIISILIIWSDLLFNLLVVIHRNYFSQDKFRISQKLLFSPILTRYSIDVHELVVIGASHYHLIKLKIQKLKY